MHQPNTTPFQSSYFDYEVYPFRRPPEMGPGTHAPHPVVVVGAGPIGLVLAILLGAAVRTAWTPDTRFQAGIDFSAKMLLEVAVVLLGASVSAATLSSLGVGFVLGIFAMVALAIVVGFGVGRALGLNPRMALLVACGNAICGNSAIAAVAPVIDADGKEVAASIAFLNAIDPAILNAISDESTTWNEPS